jgi:hypothetical protein
MASDSELFVTRDKLDGGGAVLNGNVFKRDGDRWLPLYEAKLIHHFDHRYNTFAGTTEEGRAKVKAYAPPVTAEEHQDPFFGPLPRYWVRGTEVADLLASWTHGWLIGWRDVTNVLTNRRTVIPSVVPRVGVGHKTPLMFPATEDARLVASLYASLCSFVFDYVARQKLGGTSLAYFYLKQLPVLPPATYESGAPWSPGTMLRDWIRGRVLELTYTAWDLEPWAKDLGWDGPPFRWDESRRFLLRCELDAAFFHLYAINRDDTAYILDTFPIVRRKDEQAHGEYRTKRVILEIYDAMQSAAKSGEPYETRLVPPPSDTALAHEPTRRGIKREQE